MLQAHKDKKRYPDNFQVCFFALSFGLLMHYYQPVVSRQISLHFRPDDVIFDRLDDSTLETTTLVTIACSAFCVACSNQGA